MIQKGIVKSVNGEFAVVEVMRTSACVGCSKQEGCIACKKKIQTTAYNPCGAKEGERVTLETSSATVLLYAVLVFVLPLVLTIATFIISGIFFKAQHWQIVTSTCIFILSYVIIYFIFDRNPNTKKSVVITEID